LARSNLKYFPKNSRRHPKSDNKSYLSDCLLPRSFLKIITKCFVLISCLFITTFPALGEKSLSIYEKTDTIIGKDFQNPYQLNYLPIITLSEKVYLDDKLLSRDADYLIDYALGQINIKKEFGQDSIIKIDYNIIPIALKRIYQRQLLTPQEKISEGAQKQQPSDTEKKPTTETLGLTPSSLNFSGTKTLSLSMENIRGVTINQPTRLNIGGKITENISVNALLSDEDLPLQPEGTTEELEDLDKVLIEIKGKHLSATLGDYESSFDDTEFVLSPKMLAGAQAKGDFDIGGFTLIGAVSKGQSASITLQCIEGQNEYRVSLDGKFIIMVAGSENVWLNGEKMRRERDYVIRDYGDPIVEFTNKHLLTGKDILVIDFEYVDEERNYGQKLYGTRGKIKGQGNNSLQKMKSSNFSQKSELFGLEAVLGVSYASESDDKNNPIIALNSDEIESLKRNELDPNGDGISLPAPVSSSVIGFDGKLNLSDNTFLSGEVALNKRDSNTFSNLDKPEESKAWKLNGASTGDKFRLNFDLRGFQPDFTPIGATVNSRSRSTYQKNYDQTGFGNFQVSNKTSSHDEKDYSMDLWLEPLEHIEFKGGMGKNSTEYTQPVPSKNENDYWSRSLGISLPNLPQINTRYQEVTTKQDGKEDSLKTRESLELNHKFMKKLSVKMKSEEIQSLENKNNSKRSEQKFTMDLPSFWKISLSGDFSYERDFSGSEGNAITPKDLGSSIEWLKSSSARTLTLNLLTKPVSWLDFSGYLGQRKLSTFDDIKHNTAPSDITTNVADLKLNLKYLRVNYQIDRKLSTEKEEQYVNYVITLVDGQEVKRYLSPGEGSYVRIDEYTYREDMDKGDYIRLLRNVSDKPVASLAFQTVFSLRPRISFNRKKDTSEQKSVKDYLVKSLSMIELGTRINEEQDNTSKAFYVLRELQTEKTIYGLKKYWSRTKISPHKMLSLSLDWETSTTLNKRLNSQLRRLDADRWKAKIESPLRDRIVLGGEFGKDDNLEKITSILYGDNGQAQKGIAISDISELQRFRAIYMSYSPTRIISRAELKGSYETEWNDDALADEPPVLTKTFSMQTEVSLGFMGRGTTMLRYEIAKGTSSGELPFARYDFHEGISHKVRLETSYRLKWFTDLILRATFRSEIAENTKPDNRFEMEATADF
jgi:hypothetical protein